MDTTAKEIPKELLELGYSNSDTRAFKGVDNELLFKLRRDYFLDNLYISEYCIDNFDPEEQYSIYVMEAFDSTFISLELSHWDVTNRASIDLDGDVIVSSGEDKPYFSPCVSYEECCWDHSSDESLKVGEVNMEDGYYKPSNTKYGHGHHWSQCVCIPDVQKYQVGEETLQLVIDKFNL